MVTSDSLYIITFSFYYVFFLVLDYHYLYSDMKILSIYFFRMSSVYTDIDFWQESFGYFRFSMLDSLYSHIVLSCSMIFSILVLFSIFFHLCSHILDVFDFGIVFRKMVLSCLSIFFSFFIRFIIICMCVSKECGSNSFLFLIFLFFFLYAISLYKMMMMMIKSEKHKK